jgi:(1->4)-alpha-D-glucan 1-alpha-D-glucosylmutase
MNHPYVKNNKTQVPRATYRFQFHDGFRLSEARALAPYLHELGISHLYASPLLAARPHSKHGYDTADFNHLNPELGTEAGLAELVETLRAHGMGLILDIVPNHMGIGGPENVWWWDVLARGPESRFASYFDIDWSPADPRLRGKVLVPVLNDRYHRVLEKRGLQLAFHQNEWILRHGESTFPVNAKSIKSMTLPLGEINENPEALNALIEQQFYRLTWYQHTDNELNYRRFFNIADLAGLRVEDEEVFHHALDRVRHWLQRGWLDGLRVDHPDGLRDPAQFLHRLRCMAPDAWIVVEKILQPGEVLPVSWPVDGTTGYDFLNCAGGLFVDSRGEKPLTDFYTEFVGPAPDFSTMAREKKRLVLQTSLAAEMKRLTRLLARAAFSSWRYSDFTRAELSEALTEFISCFSVYRNYAQPEEGRVNKADATHVAQAAREARNRRADLPPELFSFLADLLLLRQQGELEEEFVARFQQLSGAVMAKGVEDIVFYCFNRFIALNEVGGDPGRFGVSVDEFHQYCHSQQQRGTTGMLATSTHDTKRGEDSRTRLSLLSEIPDQWAATVRRWSTMNERHRREGWPDRNAEYFYYQTLVGAWPLSAPRAVACMAKAACEAREHTQYVEGNAKYDAALQGFVESTLGDAEFCADLEKFVAPLLPAGYAKSLALTLLKMTAPGAPDFYQGAELWDLNLVDPDNRRSVDFALRQKLLTEAKTMTAEEAWKNGESGLPKLWLIRQVLSLRERRPELFGLEAPYAALSASGTNGASVVAFKRGENLLVVVPRLVLGAESEHISTSIELPSGTWRNELTGVEHPAGPARVVDLWSKFPVALLVRKEMSDA